MKAINKVVDTFLTIMMVLSAGGLFLLTFAQVIARFVFSLPIPWSTDIIRLTFVYSVFFGASYAAKNNEHLNLDVVLSIMKPRIRQIVELVIFAIVSAFTAFLCTIATIFTFESGLTQRFPYLMIPMSIMYISILLGTGIMTFYYIQLTAHAAKAVFTRTNTRISAEEGE
jgi:TRAP-type C4-dicarboxylate transport system permease small subunit